MADSKPANTEQLIAQKAQKENGWKEDVPTGLRVPALFGLLVIALFITIFGIWAIRAPISGAAIATGIVVASGENLSVQHLEGGIISKIEAHEGDAVKQGQALVFLDETRIEVDRNRVNSSLIAMEAQKTRAEAERDDLKELKFPVELKKEATIAKLEAVLEEQRSEFRFRKEQLESEFKTIEQRKKALGEEITGLKDQIVAEQRKLEVLKSEIKSKEGLLKKGLTSRAQYNALVREEADSIGRVGALTATIGQRKTAIAEAEQQQSTLKVKRRSEGSAAANKLAGQIGDLREQLVAREDILNRSIIRAPADGVIVEITKNTIGSIVKPGETVLKILPTSNDLVVEVQLATQDIDVVHKGQSANLRFTALNTRTTPQVGAIIEYVSADRLIDEVTRKPYYLARLIPASELPPEIHVDQIYPGMPVEAFINTGERTFLEYLIKPIQDSFNKAFREE